MNPPEIQPEPEPADNEIYFDPETVDASEQFFSASLESVAARPEFVVEPAEDSRLNSESPSPGSHSPKEKEEVGERPSFPEEMADIEGRASRLSEAQDVATTAGEATASSDLQIGSDWRDVVSAKVKKYKTLKPRQERYPSLQLQFDSGPSWKVESVSRAHAETISSFLAK